MISALVLGAAAIAQTQSAQNTQNAPKVAVGKQLTAKANTPAPRTTAKNSTQKNGIGKGVRSVKASQPS